MIIDLLIRSYLFLNPNGANQPRDLLRRLKLPCYALSLNRNAPLSENANIGPQATSQ